MISHRAGTKQSILFKIKPNNMPECDIFSDNTLYRSFMHSESAKPGLNKSLFEGRFHQRKGQANSVVGLRLHRIHWWHKHQSHSETFPVAIESWYRLSLKHLIAFTFSNNFDDKEKDRKLLDLQLKFSFVNCLLTTIWGEFIKGEKSGQLNCYN